MSSIYHYRGFGLNISSEIEFPELLPYEFETADVSINYGNTPAALHDQDLFQRVGVSVTATQYLLKVNGVANYYAANGTQIIVEPLGEGIKSIRLFLLTNLMPAILHQRNMAQLHASGILYRDGVALFCGESGAGKSTLINSLAQQGYPIFSDDICVVQPSDKYVTATAGYPMTTLWADSFEKFSMEMVDEENRIRPELPKYGRYYHQSFNTTALPVKKVFILNKLAQASEPEIMPLIPLNAFTEIQKHAYRPMQMNAMQKRKIHFAAAAKIASSAEIYRVVRPEHRNSLTQLTQLIASYLQ